MKIISVSETNEQKKNPKNMDLLTVVLESNGSNYTASLFRANFLAMKKKLELVEKYGIPEKEMDEFLELVNQGYYADHYYDDEDE